MVEIKIPKRWLRDGEGAAVARIADIVVGHQCALPREHDKPEETGKHQLDTGNNWWLRKKDGERDVFILTHRYGITWQEDRWAAFKTVIETLLE